MTDGQGTTKLETNSSQTITSTQETEAFGRAIGGTGSTGSSYGYHGADGYRSDGDGPAGLEPYQKVGARYYDATFGRFLTRDTDLSQSPYAYCNGDPVNESDPSGHLPTPPATFETTGSTGIIEIGGIPQADDSDVKNPYPGLGNDPPSGITGGVTSSGLNSTVSLTSGGTTIIGQENNGNPTSVGDSGSLPLFGGLSAVFGETFNLSNPAGDSSSLGLSFMDGNVTVSGKESSTCVATGMVTVHF